MKFRSEKLFLLWCKTSRTCRRTRQMILYCLDFNACTLCFIQTVFFLNQILPNMYSTLKHVQFWKSLLVSTYKLSSNYKDVIILQGFKICVGGSPPPARWLAWRTAAAAEYKMVETHTYTATLCTMQPSKSLDISPAVSYLYYRNDLSSSDSFHIKGGRMDL